MAKFIIACTISFLTLKNRRKIMFKQLTIMVIFAIVFFLQGSTYSHADQKDGRILGERATKKESKTFHSGIKSEYRHVHFTTDQITKINKKLGREVSVTGVNYRSIYKKRSGNKRGPFLGRLYKLEVGKEQEKIVTLLEIRSEKITAVKVTSDNSSIDAGFASKYLLAHFANHSLNHVSFDITSLKKKGKIGHGCGASLHKFETTEEEYLDQMKKLKKLEDEHSLLSLIQELLAIDIVINS